MKNRKIALYSSIIPPEPSGAGLRVLRHAKAFSELGKIAFVVTETQEKPDDFFKDIEIVHLARPWNMRGRVEVKQRRVFELFLDLIDDFRSFLAWFNLLLIRGKEFDILHCFGVGRSLLFCVCLARLFGKTVIVEYTVLPEYETIYSQKKSLNPGRILKKFLTKVSHRIVAISPAIEKYCLTLGIKKEKIAMIPNGTNPDRFHPLEREKRLERRIELGFSKNHFIILNVGGFTLRKGIDTTLECFFHLQNHIENPLLVLIGTSDLDVHRKNRKLILEPLLKKGLDPGKIKFMGRLRNVEEYMQISDVLLFPTRREGFANVIIEAMGCGLCVVTKKIKGITDFIIKDKIDGVLVDSDIATDYTNAILSLYENEDRRFSIEKVAVESVATRFTEDRINEMYHRFYESL